MWYFPVDRKCSLRLSFGRLLMVTNALVLSLGVAICMNYDFRTTFEALYETGRVVYFVSATGGGTMAERETRITKLK